MPQESIHSALLATTDCVRICLSAGLRITPVDADNIKGTIYEIKRPDGSEGTLVVHQDVMNSKDSNGNDAQFKAVFVVTVPVEQQPLARKE